MMYFYIYKGTECEVRKLCSSYFNGYVGNSLVATNYRTERGAINATKHFIDKIIEAAKEKV